MKFLGDFNFMLIKVRLVCFSSLKLLIYDLSEGYSKAKISSKFVVIWISTQQVVCMSDIPHHSIIFKKLFVRYRYVRLLMLLEEEYL